MYVNWPWWHQFIQKDKNNLINLRISKKSLQINKKAAIKWWNLNVFSTQHPLPVKHSLEVNRCLELFAIFTSLLSTCSFFLVLHRPLIQSRACSRRKSRSWNYSQNFVCLVTLSCNLKIIIYSVKCVNNDSKFNSARDKVWS